MSVALLEALSWRAAVIAALGHALGELLRPASGLTEQVAL